MKQIAFKLPDEIIDRARNLKGRGDHISWRQADFIRAEVARIPDRFKCEGTRQISAAMEIGYSTARLYERMSTYYTPEIRDDYEILGFGTFREALNAPAPIRVLEWAVRQGDKYNGTPATPQVVRKHLLEVRKGRDPEEDPVAMLVAYIERASHALTRGLAIPGIREDLTKAKVSDSVYTRLDEIRGALDFAYFDSTLVDWRSKNERQTKATHPPFRTRKTGAARTRKVKG